METGLLHCIFEDPERERERSNFTQARFVSEDQNLQLENDLESVLLNITNQLYKNVEI
tara:strand:- start:49 stop:222 length:174 start_codon:yes stop_codon:yes gene_type:complete